MRNRRRRRSGIAVAADQSRKSLVQAMWTALAMAALVVLMAIASPRPAMSSEGVALGYEGYLGGLHMMTAEVDLARADKNYKMVTRATGRGLVGLLFSWKTNAFTEGAVRPDGSLVPRWHERDISQRGKRPKAIQIEYREDGVPLVARMRVGREANFKEFEDRRGTVDPMSAVAVIVDQMAAGQPCTGSFQVFDGKLRYDVTASMGEPKRLKGNKYMMYKGNAERCDLLLEAVDGFDDEELKGNPRDSANVEEEDSIVLTMWFAVPAEGVQSVPVLASADTSYGGLRVYLARAETTTFSSLEKRASLR